MSVPLDNSHGEPTSGQRLGLFIIDGKLKFVHAFSNQPQPKYRITSNETLAAGKHAIHFDFKYDGPGMGKSGTGTLSVDDKQVAQGKIERTIPIRFSLDETLDVGEDAGTPVVEGYVAKMPFKFTGVLKKVVIELGRVDSRPAKRNSSKKPTGNSQQYGIKPLVGRESGNRHVGPHPLQTRDARVSSTREGQNSRICPSVPLFSIFT